MQNNPLVTVICLSYNHAPFVIKALESVINQTYRNIEILIADDCSQDNSVEIINKWLLKYPEIKFIVNSRNLGNTKTFNRLFIHAKGEYIIDLAADDVLTSNCIQKQIDTFLNTKYQNLGLVYGNLEIINEKDQHLEYYYPVDIHKKVIHKPGSGNIYLSILGWKQKICSVSAMIRAEVLQELGGYDESLAYEDLDIWLRASKKYDFEFIDEVLVQKRELKSSLYQQFFKKNNPRTKKINQSTYKILKKAYQQNTSRIENITLLKRVHHEIALNFKNGNYNLCIQLLLLKFKIHCTFFFKFSKK